MVVASQDCNDVKVLAIVAFVLCEISATYSTSKAPLRVSSTMSEGGVVGPLACRVAACRKVAEEEYYVITWLFLGGLFSFLFFFQARLQTRKRQKDKSNQSINYRSVFRIFKRLRVNIQGHQGLHHGLRGLKAVVCFDAPVRNVLEYGRGWQ